MDFRVFSVVTRLSVHNVRLIKVASFPLRKFKLSKQQRADPHGLISWIQSVKLALNNAIDQQSIYMRPVTRRLAVLVVWMVSLALFGIFHNRSDFSTYFSDRIELNIVVQQGFICAETNQTQIKFGLMISAQSDMSCPVQYTVYIMDILWTDENIFLASKITVIYTFIYLHASCYKH